MQISCGHDDPYMLCGGFVLLSFDGQHWLDHGCIEFHGENYSGCATAIIRPESSVATSRVRIFIDRIHPINR